MNYGTKPKPKPKIENLTFNKAKNSWIKELKGKNKYKYEIAVMLIDMLRNDYLAGNNEAWEEWKATPLIDLDEKLASFTWEFVSKVENKSLRSNLLYMIDSLYDHVNNNLLNGSTTVLLLRTVTAAHLLI